MMCSVQTQTYNVQCADTDSKCTVSIITGQFLYYRLFPKFLKKTIYSQLYAYFNENNLLTEQQYGFRAQHSTELASVKLVDNIIKEMDDAHGVNTPVAIYCDLSKAFDCLNFDIFLAKMEYYGVSGTPLALIKSYLTNRYQYVHFESCKSDLLEIKTGIPQGSILGPLFFSILINDIVNSSSKL